MALYIELGTIVKLKERLGGGLSGRFDVSILNLLFETNDIAAEFNPTIDVVLIEPKAVRVKKSMGNVISIFLIVVKLPLGAKTAFHEKL